MHDLPDARFTFDMSVTYDQYETDPRYRYKLAIAADRMDGDTPTLFWSADGRSWKTANQILPGFSDTIPNIHHDIPGGDHHDFIIRQQWLVHFDTLIQYHIPMQYNG